VLEGKVFEILFCSYCILEKVFLLFSRICVVNVFKLWLMTLDHLLSVSFSHRNQKYTGLFKLSNDSIMIANHSYTSIAKCNSTPEPGTIMIKYTVELLQKTRLSFASMPPFIVICGSHWKHCRGNWLGPQLIYKVQYLSYVISTPAFLKCHYRRYFISTSRKLG
jgi:hypothetical protein